MTIREDERQWLIYQEKPVTQVVAAVEAFLMNVGAYLLMNHPDQAMRAIGHAGERISETRLEHWRGNLNRLEPTELQAQLVEYLDQVIEWMSQNPDGPEVPRPDQALDEIQAALVWADKRGMAAGVVGEGWYREILRESTLGKA